MAFSIMSLFVTVLSLFVVIQAASAALLPRAPLDVWVPTIIQPYSRETWVIGQNATVAWDTSNAPQTISNKASVVLNRNCGDNIVLASGFNLKDGSVNVTVPVVPQGPYFITLFGDSGNYSPVFTIASGP